MNEQVEQKLNRAVALALELGVPCSGWVVQRASDHVAIWLYYEDDDTHTSLLPTIEVFKTFEEAADWCLESVRELQAVQVVPLMTTTWQET